MATHPFIVESHDLPDLPWSSLLGRPLCFVDIETNGTGDDGRIIEVALIRLEGGAPEKAFATLLHARHAGQTDLHGIQDSDLRDAPTFQQALPVLREMVEGTVLVAHSASFERRFLARELDALGGEWKQPMLCTLRLARALHPERSGRGAHTQAGLAELYGLDWDGPSHEALPDTVQHVLLVTEMLRAHLTSPSLAEAVTNAVIEHEEGTRWPEPMQGRWLPKHRGAFDTEAPSDEALPAPAPKPRDASAGGTGAMVLLGAALLALVALAWLGLLGS